MAKIGLDYRVIMNADRTHPTDENARHNPRAFRK
jgi:hypothetical protein